MGKIVDARGYACPEPLVMTKKQVEEKEQKITVLVDTNVAKENVERFLLSSGYKVTISEEGEDYKLVANKE